MKTFLKHSEPYVVDVASEGQIEPENELIEKPEQEKFFVPNDIDDATMAILKSIVKDKQIIRAEKKEQR